VTDTAAVQRELLAAQRHILTAQQLLLGAPPPITDVITDRAPRPLPTLPAIAVGEVIVDPTFGSRILRVTGPDTNPQAPGVSYRSSDSTIQRAWNSTISRFTVEDTYGQQLVFDFHPQTLRTRFLRQVRFDRRRHNPRTMPDRIVPFNGSDCSWHDTNPDRLYGRSGNTTIKVFDFATEQMTTVVELADVVDLPPDTYTSGVCVMNNTLMTTCGGSINDDNHIIIVGHLPPSDPPDLDDWQLLDTLLLTNFNNGKGFLLHSTTMDLTGRYILMVPSEKSQVPGHHLFVWDMQVDRITEIDTAVSGHCALGQGVYVNQDCAPGTTWDAAQWTFRRFDHPNDVVNTINPVLTPQEISLGEHPSWTNMRTLTLADPFVTATYRYAPSDVPWRAWDEEVVTIAVATGEVRRQCHHRSQVLDAYGIWDYWATPRPNISNDGKWALFTSNWGRTLGTDSVEGAARQDAFIVELR
jgi:hypothetical protein